MHEAYKSAYTKDYYGVRKDALDPGAFLDPAAIPRMCPPAKKMAGTIFEQWRTGSLPDREKNDILIKARKNFAELINLPNERGVVIGFNTTEIMSLFCRWLSGLMYVSRPGRIALTTDAECPATESILKWFRSEGNVFKQDRLTTYSPFSTAHHPEIPRLDARPTSVHIEKFQVLNRNDDHIIEQVQKSVAHLRPKLLVFSYVLRGNGRILPAKRIIDAAREVDPSLIVVLDAAQALGNLPQIDFPSLGCDFIAASPHKTMESGVAGFGAFDPLNPRIERYLDLQRRHPLADGLQVVLPGMFDPTLQLKHNTDGDLSYPDIAAFNAAVRSLKFQGLLGDQGNFSELDKQRQGLHSFCESELTDIATSTRVGIYNVIGPRTPDQPVGSREHQSSFIDSYRIGNRKATRYPAGYRELFFPQLCRLLNATRPARGRRVSIGLEQKNVGVAYLGYPYDLLRVSYAASTTEKEITYFAHCLWEILRTKKS